MKDAIATTTSSELAIRSGQTEFTPVQVAALRQIGVEDATDADLQMYFHHCRRTGLDPFARQIYMIGRETDVKVRVPLPNGNSRVETQRVTKYTIQTGIDGYRLIGHRAAVREAVLISHDEPQWVGRDGVWRSFWPKSEGTPVAAKYTIRVDGAPYPAVCMFEEFAQYKGNGELNSMWKKMPANQLAIRAEAAAWRKAFPADFAGIDDSGAPAAVDSEPTSSPPHPPHVRQVTAEEIIKRQPRKVQSEVTTKESERLYSHHGTDVDELLDDPGRDGGNDLQEGAEPSAGAPLETPAGDQAQTSEMSEQTRRKWLNRMFALLAEANCTDRTDQLIVLGHVTDAGYLEHRDSLDDEQLRATVNELNDWSKTGVLEYQVNEILNTAAIAAEAKGDQTP